MQKSASSVRLSLLEGGGAPPQQPPAGNSGSSSPKRNQQTIRLTCGLTAYSLLGPSPASGARGVVVCIHGLTLASYVFTDIAQTLASPSVFALCL